MGDTIGVVGLELVLRVGVECPSTPGVFPRRKLLTRNQPANQVVQPDMKLEKSVKKRNNQFGYELNGERKGDVACFRKGRVKNVASLVDTGATISVISAGTVSKVGLSSRLNGKKEYCKASMPPRWRHYERWRCH